MSKNKSKKHEQFVKEVYGLVGNDYEIVDTYLNAKTKINILHKVCGKVYQVKPNNFLSGKRCPYCANKYVNHDDFVKKVYKLVGDEYEVIGIYIKSNIKLKMKHNICNTIYDVKPNNFLNGRRCPNCCKRNTKKSNEEFVEEVFNLTGNEYTVLSEYKYNKEKIKIRHNTCETVYYVQPISFLSGSRCPKCANNMKKTTYIFKKEVSELVKNEYEVIGEYINDATKIRIKHNICDCVYEVIPNSFLNGTRCPFCKISKGEEKIKIILDEFSLHYVPQYKSDDCRNKLPLPFDFAIFDNKGSLLCLIEYDGIQHFKPFVHFGGEEKFKITQYHDSIKSEYCRINNISLLRIPYWDFDRIEEILKDEII